MGEGSVSLAFATGPTWDAVHSTARTYRDAGYDILRLEVASDIFTSLQHEGELYKMRFDHCYLEVCGFPLYLNEGLVPGDVVVIERTASR